MKLLSVIFILSLIVSPAYAGNIIEVIKKAEQDIQENALETAYADLLNAESRLRVTENGEEFLDIVFAMLSLTSLKLGDVNLAAEYAEKSLAIINKYKRNDNLTKMYKSKMESILAQSDDKRSFTEKLNSLFLNTWFKYVEYADSSKTQIKKSYLAFSRIINSKVHECRFGYANYSMNRTKLTDGRLQDEDFDLKRVTWIDTRKIKYIQRFFYNNTNRVQVIRVALDSEINKNTRNKITTKNSYYNPTNNNWEKERSQSEHYHSYLDIVVGNESMGDEQLRRIENLFKKYQKHCSKK